MMRAVLLAILILSMAQPVRAEDPNDKLEVLRALLTQRLVIMTQVAMFKWNAGLPVDDAAREANVIRATVARARAEGLNASFARRVVAAQIEAAKIVQQDLFQQWRAAGIEKIEDAPDLATNLRPRIGQLTGELIAALAIVRGNLDSCEAKTILRPVPHELANRPQAWDVAIDGMLGANASCH